MFSPSFTGTIIICFLVLILYIVTNCFAAFGHRCHEKRVQSYNNFAKQPSFLPTFYITTNDFASQPTFSTDKRHLSANDFQALRRGSTCFSSSYCSAMAVKKTSLDEFSAVSTLSCTTPMMKPTATACMATP